MTVQIVKALETVETACSARTAHSARTGRTNNPSACTILVRFPNPLLEASELGNLTRGRTRHQAGSRSSNGMAGRATGIAGSIECLPLLFGVHKYFSSFQLAYFQRVRRQAV